MPLFRVVYHSRFRKALRKVRKAGRADIVDALLHAVDRLGEDPVSPRSGLDVLRLAGYPPHSFRLRIGDYRILYHVDIDTRTVTLIDVFHRGRGYRP